MKLLSLALTSLSFCLAQPVSESCGNCHRQIAESYARTGMGRSFRALTAATAVPGIQGGTFYHEPSAQFFSLSTRRGERYLRRYQTGFDGGMVNLLEASLDYAIGSGNHATSYLHRTAAGDLVEMPLTWYPEDGGYWAMSPAYDRPDHAGFGRKVSYRCLFCHNAYPAMEPGEDALESGTRFPARLPEGIDCQRCHGPGQAHIDAVRIGRPPAAVRSSIVNPALPGTRAANGSLPAMSLGNHQPGPPGELMRFGRGVFSYRPGEPLVDYALYFDLRPAPVTKANSRSPERRTACANRRAFWPAAGRSHAPRVTTPTTRRAAKRPPFTTRRSAGVAIRRWLPGNTRPPRIAFPATCRNGGPKMPSTCP